MPNVLEIPISGTNPVKHITVITMTPQWSEPMETTFNTQTTILETLSGKESRTARLYRPLVGIDFVGIAADQAEHQLYKAIFERWSETGIYAVPLWMDAVNLDADITADETHRVQTFSANGFNRLFRWFRYALLWQSPEHCQIIEIKYINKGAESHNPQIVCRGFDDAKVKMSFNKGDFLVPLAIGSISQPDREFLTNAINTIQISFVEKQGAIKFYSGSDESDSLLYYRNYTPKASDDNNTVYTEEKEPANYNQFVLMPNWDLSENIYRDQDDVYYDALDGGLAKPYIINNKNKLKISLGYTVDRTQLQDIIKFFEYHDGCKGSFLVPTWTADFPEGETPTDYFVVKDDLSVEYMGQSAYNGNDVQFFCKAVMCRFAEDTLEVKALTNNLYQVVCNFVQCDCAVRTEEVNGTRETVNTDIENKVIYLYELTRNGENTVNRYANYGYGVTVNDNYYAAADIAYTEIVKDVETLDNKIEVSCSGLDDVLALNMRVEIMRAEITTEGTEGTISGLTSIFKGIVTQLSTEANGVRLLDVESDLYCFDNDVPRIKLQRQCNWRFGDEQCGVINEKVIKKKAEDGGKYYLFTQGDSANYENAARFQAGFLFNGTHYEIKGLSRVNDNSIGAPGIYKFPITFTGALSASNNLFDNTIYYWYQNKVKINGVVFGFRKNGTSTEQERNHGNNFLLNSDDKTNWGIDNGHYKDFIHQTFTQEITASGYTAGAIPLTFKTVYFDTNLVMQCMWNAPSYVGVTESKALCLPQPGSTVTINTGTENEPNNIALVIKEYVAGENYNYIIFEDDANLVVLKNKIESLGDWATLPMLFNGNKLGWSLLRYSNESILVEYNVMRIEVEADGYSAIGNIDSNNYPSVRLRRYCNKQISCCKDCYNNVARFGGFPWLPNNTPYEYTQSTSSGKK